MKKKNKISNIIMVVAIIAIIISGVMVIGNLKGWFNKSEYADNAIIESTLGSANIERSGVGYSVDKGTQLRSLDILETKANSKAEIKSGENIYILAENSEINLIEASNDKFEFELIKGEVFCVINDAKTFAKMWIGSDEITADGTVFSANIQTGSSSVIVYEGSVTFGDKTADAGNVIHRVAGVGSVGKLQPTSLNEFNIEQAMKANDSRTLCFDDVALQKVIDSRNQEIKLAAEQKAKADAEIIAQGGTEAQVSTTTTESAQDPNVKTCTIQILCDTILDNMDDLTPGKNAYVPANGVILATSTVQFVEGETAFDVLKRACEYAGIQIEYSWTPGYNSYYVEGINHLYEFDCGYESGWMYKVNGWFPNYGSSSYELKDGDVMVWTFTCEGLGADVGGGLN